jgi:hypothetical protein
VRLQESIDKSATAEGRLDKGDVAIEASSAKAAESLDRLAVAADRVAAAQDKAAAASEKTATKVDAATAAETKAGKSSGASSKLMLGTVAAIAGLGYESIKSALALNAASTQIAASGNVSLKTANTMTTSFQKMATGSEYSGLQVVQAFGPMAGVFQTASGHAITVHDSLLDMRAAMDLATASGLPLTSVTKQLATIMRSYHINAQGAAGASNVLWNMSRLLGMSMTQVGTIFTRLRPKMIGGGMSLAQVAGAALEMTKVLGTGRQAISITGTALQTIINPSKGATKVLAQMGISMENNKGQFIGMGTALDLLRSHLQKLPPYQLLVANTQKTMALQAEMITLGLKKSTPAIIAQKLALTGQLDALKAAAAKLTQNSVLQTLFGKNAKAMTTLVMGGSAALAANTKIVSSSESAHAAAAKQLSSMAGQWKVFRADISNFLTTVGTTLLPILEKFVKDLMPIVTTTMDWMKNNKTLVLTLLGLAVGIMAMVKVVKLVSEGIKAAQMAMKAFQAISKLIADTNPWILIAIALIALTLIIIKYHKQIWNVIKKVWKDVENVVRGVFSHITSIVRGMDRVWQDAEGAVRNAFGHIVDIVQGVWNWIKTHWQLLLAIFLFPIAPVVAAFILFHKQIIGTIVALISDIKRFFMALPNWIKTNIIDPVVGFFTRLYNSISHTISTLVGWIKSHWKLLLAIFLLPIAPVIAAFVLFHKQIIGFISGVIDWVRSHFSEITDKVRNVVNDVINFVKKHWILLLGPLAIVINWVKDHFGEITDKVRNVVNDIVNFFKSLPAKIMSGLANLGGDFLHLGKNLITSLINGIKSAPGAVLHAIESMIPGAGLISSGLKALHLATGAIVSRPTLAVVGESGPEAVVPLSGFKSPVTGGVSSLPSFGGGGGGGGGNIYNVFDFSGCQVMSDADMQKFAQKVSKAFGTVIIPQAGHRFK